MELPINGPMYEHASRDLNYQRCVNLFPVASPDNARTSIGLLPTAGLKELVNASGSEVRGLINVDDVIYAVVDDTVYKLTINDNAETATAASIGTIASTSGRVSMSRNPTQIMIVDGSTSGYIVTIATDAVAAISDADFTGGDQVVFLDSYFIYNTPDAATMYATAINDGTDISALDVATAEGLPDKLLGLAVDKRELWAFGERSVEVWYNAANSTGFPLSRRDGAFIDLGCGAANSILNIDNTLMWIDHRGFVVRAQGYSPVIVSNEAISNEIRSYSTISDAYAWQYTDRGHLFYVISFPTVQKTWSFDLTTQQWHEMAYFNQDDEFEHHLGNCHTRYKQWDLTGDRKSGKIYILKGDYYKDGDDPIHRLRTTQHHNMEFNQVGIDCLELHMEAGKGLTTGTGSNPQVMMRYSQDGGYTWSHELTRSSGKIGEYDKRIRWNRLGTGREWIFEFRISDPIPFAILDASVDISPGHFA